eukprot:4409939-Prymnesium_polylepis.1
MRPTATEANAASSAACTDEGAVFARVSAAIAWESIAALDSRDAGCVRWWPLAWEVWLSAVPPRNHRLAASGTVSATTIVATAYRTRTSGPG